MEKCQPANVKESEVKAEQFIAPRSFPRLPLERQRLCPMCHWTSAAHRIGLKKFKKGNKVEIFFISTCSQPQAKLWFNTKLSNFLQIKDFQIRHNVRVDLQVLNGSHALNSKHILFKLFITTHFLFQLLRIMNRGQQNVLSIHAEEIVFLS